MQTTTSGDRNGAVDGGRFRRRRPAGRLLLGAAVGLVALLGSAGPAASAECTTAMLFLRLCGATPTPLPAPTTTTTAPPLASLPPVTLPPVTLPPVLTPPPAPVTSVEAARRLFDLVNAERQKAGLGALTSRDDITAIAVAHSQRMAEAGDIFHSDSFMSAAVKSLLGAGVRGENVAYNGDIDAAHARLMASPGHRANILDGRFSVAGFGVVRHADGRWFITQDFIQPAGAPRSVAPVASRSAAPPRAAAPRPVAPAAKASPAPTAAAAPPTTVAVPAPAPEAEPAPAPPLVVETSAPAAILEVDRAGSVTGPLTGAAVVLLGLALSACLTFSRRRRIG